MRFKQTNNVASQKGRLIPCYKLKSTGVTDFCKIKKSARMQYITLALLIYLL